MAKIYYRLVKAGSWSIDNVPSLWRSQVEGMLEEDGQ